MPVLSFGALLFSLLVSGEIAAEAQDRVTDRVNEAQKVAPFEPKNWRRAIRFASRDGD